MIKISLLTGEKNFYRVVAPHQMDDMDTAEEDCLEKRGFPSL